MLLRNAPSQVLAVHPGPIEFERLPFVNVARLLSAMPVPVPRILGALRTRWASSRSQDLGDVTLQAHLGAAVARRARGALPRRRSRSSRRCSGAARELASPDYVPYGIAFDVEKLTWELQFFAKHFLEGYRGAALDAGRRARRWRPSSRRSSRSWRPSRACSAIATITAAT